MHKIKFLYSLFILFILCSCSNEEKYPGYSQTGSGLYYKLQSIGDGQQKPVSGDYLQLVITYKTETDSVFMDTYSKNETGMVIMPFNKPTLKGSIEEVLSMMIEGDSVSFIIDAQNLFANFLKSDLPIFLNPESKVKMDVKLHKILNETDYANELEHFKSLIEDRDIEEQRKIQLFIDTNRQQFSPLKDGMYYLPISQGTGPFPERGNTVKIHFTGSFLNGRIFESTYQRVPLEFVYGEQDQVIKGIEYAISLMNESSKTKFIIPSHLAYGEYGSSTGIVPPYTSVIYEIELLKLN